MVYFYQKNCKKLKKTLAKKKKVCYNMNAESISDIMCKRRSILMKKTELIDKVAEKTGLTKKDIGAVLDAYYESLEDAFVAGEGFQIVGFGSFAVKERAARTGRNPATNATITIPASRRVVFTCGKALKDKLN